jgi:Flp pilus assembly protein TadD
VPFRFGAAFRAGLGVLVLGAFAAPAMAQQAPAPAAPGTMASAMPVPRREALQLNAALSRLSREPRNIEALIDAGDAATQLGDYEAAEGFFKRGRSLAPGNPRLLTGLAGVLVRQGNAAAAILLFDQAQAIGASMQAIASDRGLAHDLIGDPVGAQRFYAQALAASPGNPEVLQRLAISQAISGDSAAMEKTLLPLLKAQDKAAWRTRAFGLAMLGETREATRIVRTLLPGALADGITPYLQYMPRLTAAQKAAAANLGIFPRASEIGTDSARIAALTPGGTPVQAGKPPGREAGNTAAQARALREQQREAEERARRVAREAQRTARREAQLAQAASRAPRAAPPEPRPTREAGSPQEPQFTVPGEQPVPKVAAILDGRPPAVAAPKPAPVPAPAPAPVVAAAPVSSPVPAPAPPQAPAPQVAVAAAPPPLAPAVAAPAPTASVAATGFNLARLPATGAPVAAPAAPAAAAAQQTPPAAAAAQPSFGALFADLGKPSTAAAPTAGAVDIRRIEPARPKPKPEAAKPDAKAKAKAEASKPPPPSHPSRIWVQLGIGQKVPALTADWRRRIKANPEPFKGRKPFFARLNQTNRLLTGPFASQRDAAKFIADLEKAGISGPYVWTSPAGEVVDELPR